jgi:diguanylate cyclase (GGDEF)-like protein
VIIDNCEIALVLHTQPLALVGASIHTCMALVLWFPLGYAAAFFLLETRRAITISSLICLASLGPLLLQGVFRNTSALGSTEWFLLLNISFAQPLFIAALAGIAYHKGHSANIDYLTGIPNRRSATQTLEEQLWTARRVGQPLSFILLDIDHFKHINDTYGHDVGDQVLIDVSASLRQRLRHTDYVGRWGGEEFIVIATRTTTTDAAVLAERLRGAVSERLYPPVGRVTLSLGVATATLNDTSQTLVKRADKALYQAKQRGRNGVAIAMPTTSA